MTTQLKKEIRNNIKDSNGNMSYVELITKEYNFDINFEEYRAFAVSECEKFLLNETKKTVKKQIRKFVKLSGSSVGYVRTQIENEFPTINFDDYKEYTNSLFNKGYKNVQSSIRASVRYQ